MEKKEGEVEGSQMGLRSESCDSTWEEYLWELFF